MHCSRHAPARPWRRCAGVFAGCYLAATVFTAGCSTGGTTRADAPGPAVSVSFSSPSAVPGTTADSAFVADVELIERSFAESAKSWEKGARIALESTASRSYPPGAWTAETVSLPFRRRAAVEGGEPVPSLDAWITGLDKAGYRASMVIDRSSITFDGAWVIPANLPGGGERPAGRVYQLGVTVSSNASDNGTRRTIHVTVVDGRVYGFPEV